MEAFVDVEREERSAARRAGRRGVDASSSDGGLGCEARPIAGLSKFVSDLVCRSIMRSRSSGPWVPRLSISNSFRSSACGRLGRLFVLAKPRTRTSASVLFLRIGFLPLGKGGRISSLSAIVEIFGGGTGVGAWWSGPYSQVTSLSLSLCLASEAENSMYVEVNSEPVELLGVYSFELSPFLPPGTPTGVFKPDTIRDIILLSSHVSPSVPYICLLPSVKAIASIVSKSRRQSGWIEDILVAQEVDLEMIKTS